MPALGSVNSVVFHSLKGVDPFLYISVIVMTDRLPGKFRSSLHSGPFNPYGFIKQGKLSYSSSGLTKSAYRTMSKSVIPGAKPSEPDSDYKYFPNVDEVKKETEPTFKLFKEL
jgi:hypothetical protein